MSPLCALAQGFGIVLNTIPTVVTEGELLPRIGEKAGEYQAKCASGVCASGRESALPDQVVLDRVIGSARVVDLTFVNPGYAITAADLEANAPPVTDGDILLIRTDWTNQRWGQFPEYYADSPVCSPEAAEWLAAKRLKAVGFDCFAEESAKSNPFSPEDFDVHRIVGDSGAILCQQLYNLALLPPDDQFLFLAPFVKLAGGEGAPARFFALVEE